MSQVNVIDSIVITQESNTSNILAEWIELDPDITVHGELTSAQAVKLFLNWSDQGGSIPLQTGDYFTFVIPDVFMQDNIKDVTDAEIKTALDEVVATYSISENSDHLKEVTITFTDYVETHTDISGDFWLLLFVGRVDSKDEKDLKFVVNGEIEVHGEVTVNPEPPNNRKPENRKVGKSVLTDIYNGYYIFNWTVYLNMYEDPGNGFQTIENFSFEDVIPEDSPHVFLTDEIRLQLGLDPEDFPLRIGEYTQADSLAPGDRYPYFRFQYNGTGDDQWFLDYEALADGYTTVGIDGGNGLDVLNFVLTEKSLSADLGRLTRPIGIQYCTIATVKLAESALGDPEVVTLINNEFKVSYGEDLLKSLDIYIFKSGGSAQGITGDYSFEFTKVNKSGDFVPGAVFSLFITDDLTLGADRIVYSDNNGIVTFNNLPAGTYYMQETEAPNNYVLDSTIYKVELRSTGFDILFGENFENDLRDNDYEIVNKLEPVLVPLTGTKILADKPLESGMFRFVVKDSGGRIVATGTNEADGSISFSEIEFDLPDVYVLTVEEVIVGFSEFVYDGTQFTVTVTVTDDGTGKLESEVTYPEGGIVFSNSCVGTSIPVTLRATKTLTGKTLEGGMFSFVVKDSGGATVATGTNETDGSITFSSLHFTEQGVFTFTIEETRGSYTGITYDESNFTVTVTITDDGGGTLTEEVEYPEGGVVFSNSYTAPIWVPLTGTKKLTGQTLSDGMFNFVVKDIAGRTVATGTNEADGSISFSGIEFNLPGVYSFTIEETRGSYAGITYDGSKFTVTVTLTDNGDGTLTENVEYPEGGVVFNNGYAATPVPVTLEATKALTGKTLLNGMFNFVVKNIGGTTVATGINKADGSIAFSSMYFDEPGVYTFTVEEARGSYSGITYDGSIFTVTVTVTDGGNGSLLADISYPVGGIDFNNSYAAPPKKPCQCFARSTKCRKTIIGHKIWIDNDNERDTRPPSVEISLLRDGKVYQSIDVDSNGDGKFIFCCIPIGKNPSYEYDYQVDELNVPDGYTKKVEGYNVINTLTP